MTHRCPSLHAFAVALLLFAPPVGAQSQYVVRAPYWEWRSVSLPHWEVHYPARAQAFADCLVPRLESIHGSVSSLVGYAGPTRTTLVITDAQSFDGAFASANSRAPVVVLQTQPSTPRSGGWSDCATARMTHELTHILQLSRPWTRDHSLFTRIGMRLLPAAPGPVVLRRKPWLRESYAEHVEGRLTPTGAPYTTARSDAIRDLWRARRFPEYRALDNTYEGRYLVGAAFVEELANRSGDSAFARLWERMASPTWAGDDVELARLFGAHPESLYVSFRRRATSLADTVDTRSRRSGLVAGRRVRRIGYTDQFAVSPDGSTLAAVYGSPLLQLTLAAARDSSAPSLRFPLSTGQSPNAPRFTPDGRRILFIAWELISDGVWRPDVFEWSVVGPSLRRVTRAAAIREIDPMPDGQSAVGTRCEFGVCDLVRLDLRDGSLSVLAHGSPSRMFSRPRVSPDGRVIVAVQSGARSRVAVLEASGQPRYIDPEDGAWRYEPSWLRDGRIVLVSDASGIPAIEIIDPRTGARSALTRTLLPAYAPEQDPVGDSVYYVLASPGGSIVQKIALSAASDQVVTRRDSALSPALPVRVPHSIRDFTSDSSVAWRAYGRGRRFYSMLPSGSWSADGVTGGLQLWTSDIVGRLSIMGTAHFGQHRALHGFGATGMLRATRLPLIVDAAFAEQTFSTPMSQQTEMDYAGGALRTEWNRGPWARRQSATLGVVYGQADLTTTAPERLERVFAGGSYGVNLTQIGEWYASEQLTFAGSGGASGGNAVARSTASARVEVGRVDRGPLLALAGTAGILSAGSPLFEHFSVGGASPTLVGDLALVQRVPHPLLPSGTLTGRRVAVAQVTGPKVGPLTPFVWSAAADSIGNRQSLAGFAWSVVDDPRRNWRVPGVQLRASAAYAFGELRGARAQLSLGWAQ